MIRRYESPRWRVTPSPTRLTRLISFNLNAVGTDAATGHPRNEPVTEIIVSHLRGAVQHCHRNMYRAFQYGAPPHGGMAAGLDRIVMLLCGTTNLREISLFPMNQQAMDLLMGTPSEASPKQLRELHIRTNLPNKA